MPVADMNMPSSLGASPWHASTGVDAMAAGATPSLSRLRREIELARRLGSFEPWAGTAHRGKLAIDGQHDFEGASLSSLEPDARFAEPFSPVRGEENGYGEGDLRQRRAVRNLRTPTGSVLI